MSRASIVTPWQWHYFVSFARCSKLLVENLEIFIPHLYSVPPRGWPRRNFAKMLDTHKTRMIGLPSGEENVTICEAVSIPHWYMTDRRTYHTGTWQTDGHTTLVHDRQTDIPHWYMTDRQHWYMTDRQTYHTGTWQTDNTGTWQTDGQNCYVNIAHQSADML